MIRNVAPAAPSNIRPMTFGQKFGQAASSAPESQPEAEIWLNIGYETGDENYPIVTLPFGIPIDTQKSLNLRGSNPQFNAFTAARNGLLEQIQEAAKQLAPGEDMIIGGQEGGLVLQLRRRGSAAEAPAPDNNPFAAQFTFAKVPAAA